MVGLGLLMILSGLASGYLRLRGRLYESRGFHRFALAMGPAGVIALLAGWITTEVGRQPWVVYGLLRTSDAVSGHSAGQVGTSLAIFFVAYLLVFGVGVTYLLRLMRRGPAKLAPMHPHHEDAGPGRSRQPMRPLSGAELAIDEEEHQGPEGKRDGD